jgi:thermostable 8-oxoguanine DNA glycosylase
MTETALKVDSLNPCLYDGTDEQLQQFLLLAVVVAGKTAAQQQKKLDAFLLNVWRESPGVKTLMQAINEMSTAQLRGNLVRVKMGQYNRLTQLVKELAYRIESGELELRTCAAKDLEAFPGLGPKTARFFLLYTRKEIRVAVLDTHILRWMQENLVALLLRPGAVPKSTPSGERYAVLERAFLRYCDTHGLDPAQFDLALWKAGSQK